jgi:two-component system response regulator DesR
VIKVLLAHQNGLTRGALAAIIDQKDDLEVVGRSGHGDELGELVRRGHPDVVVLDFDLPTSTPMTELCVELVSRCRVLVVADRRSAACRGVEVATLAPRIGLIATDSSPEVLIEGVRKMARGETVLDPGLARAALVAVSSPLTEREREVLQLAEAGLTARDIAAKLFLSHGTVRNHLSRVMTKTGARTRIEAIRTAQEAGWI